MSLIYTAQTGTFGDFLKVYSPADATLLGAGGRSLLFYSVMNRDVDTRVAITTRLLDDGADASIVSGGINVLHVLFGRRGHNAELEAPVLRRLIERGADVNLVSKRSGPPLVGLMEHGPLPESARIPFYSVFFERSDLDLDVPAMRAGKSLKDFILAHSGMPLLREYVLEYESAKSSGM